MSQLPDIIKTQLHDLLVGLDESVKPRVDQAINDLSMIAQNSLLDPDNAEQYAADAEVVYNTLASLGVISASITQAFFRKRLAEVVSGVIRSALAVI